MMLPGIPCEAVQYPDSEQAGQLEKISEAGGNNGTANTRQVADNGQPLFVNRLILEDSPYLQQHAHNPIDWYPWGDEAFERAQRENKPIFLSIGYSTCFWCHEMGRETFDNVAVADLLNRHFVSIKVDRERHPEVDALYLSAVTLITGSSGWPLSVFLTPDGKAFIGGSYFPPDRFSDLLVKIDRLWSERPELVQKQAETISEQVSGKSSAHRQTAKIDTPLLVRAMDDMLYRYDRENGGFDRRPKFPRETWLSYLLEASVRFENDEAIRAVEKSLQAMATGGIYDQIGGGFHRYATDSRWQRPHFEKMLYNQAQLSRVYLRAYQITDRAIYARIAEETLDYVLRDLRSETGGFYSATDAESGAEEGDYYVWSREEITRALPLELAGLAIDLYGVTEAGNFNGKNLLYLPRPLSEFAESRQLPLRQLMVQQHVIRTKLAEARARRQAPFRDEKMITSWNAMMIRSLATAADILRNPDYLVAAEKAAEFIWANRNPNNHRLWRIHFKNRPSVPANQEDYAYYAAALLRLYDVTGEELWLTRARSVADSMLQLFWDDRAGGFFANERNNENLPGSKTKLIKDNEIAAANAVALQVLSQLAKRSGDIGYEAKASETMAAFSVRMGGTPIDYGYFLLAAAEHLYGEQKTLQYAARGSVVIRADSALSPGSAELAVVIKVAPGWHINAHQPLQDYLIATKISISEQSKDWRIGAVTYPEPVVKRLGFVHEPLALYEGAVKIRVPVRDFSRENGLLPLTVNLQACNDKTCLPPETVSLHIPVKNRRG